MATQVVRAVKPVRRSSQARSRLMVLPAVVDAPEREAESESEVAAAAAVEASALPRRRRRVWPAVLESVLMAGAGLGVAAMLLAGWEAELADERVVPGVRLGGREVG